MFFKKEIKLQEVMKEHLGTVEKAVASWREALFSYLENNTDEFDSRTRETIAAESRADEVRREAQVLLYEGAHLPAFREDLLDLLELTDTIADNAEKGVNSLKIESPVILPEWNEALRNIIEETHRSFTSFREAFSVLSTERSRTLSSVHRVQAAEKKVDELQDDLMEKVFHSQLSLAHKLQVRDLVLTLSSVSDSSENASDKIALMAIKGRV